MLNRIAVVTGLLVLLAVPAMAHDTPTVDEKIAGLEKMCQETATARGERQAKEPLYFRLGGDEKIATLFWKVVARHRVNEPIKHLMEGVDDKILVEHLVDFVSAGTGGGAEYTGRSMPAAHAHLKLTDADFLAAGGDIVASMKEMEYGQNEIDEFMCILMSLKDQVVLK